MNQPTNTPTRKVAAGGAAGAVVIVIMYAAAQFGLDLPQEVGAAIAVLVVFGASYLKRER